MKNNKYIKAIISAVIPTYIYVAIQVFVFIITGIVFGFYFGNQSEVEVIQNKILENISVLMIISAIITLFIFKLVDKRDKDKGKIEIKKLILYVVIGIILTRVINYVIDISGVSQFDSNFKQALNIIVNAPFIVQILGAGIILPIVEEYIFRRMIYIDFEKLFNEKVAIISTAVLFGIFHMNIIQGVFATILGLYLAYVYSKTRNLVYPICIHVVTNIVTLSIAYFLV